MTDRKPALDEDTARRLLARERDRVEKAIAAREELRQGGLEEIETAVEPAEDAERIEEVQIDDALLAQLRDELAAIERAEKRLDEGTYGFSIESGEPIPAGRLEAVPWAERTAEEQERWEQGR